MSPFEPLQPDTRQQQRTMCIADTRMIALIASKKNFNPDKERLLIEKARLTKCKCHNFTGTEPCCFYRNCRHTVDTHYKEGKPIIIFEKVNDPQNLKGLVKSVIMKHHHQ
jgi:hypothetical protein